jgi:lipopolysaccharide export system protein LptA
VLRINAPTKNSIKVPGSQGDYTTYLGGGTVTLRCGDALMTGDSAVHFEKEERAQMIGNVVYRDTTRTLEADRLTYFESSDQVLSEGNVRLVRLSTGARLDGPQASFFRAASANSRTIATGRPRMTIPAERPGGEAIVVDADVAEFLGDDQAFATGDVVIQRSDFHATSDSSRFSPAEGRLYGDPVISARGMSLSGDSVRTTFVEGDLDLIHAQGDARATGDELELRAVEILVDTGPEDVERAWAFGEGRSIGATPKFVIAGDSIDFAFTGGDIDSVTSVGTARAFQLNDVRLPQGEVEEPEISITTDADWIEGDSIRGWFTVADPAAAESGEPLMRRLLARGAARSLFSAARDSTATARQSRNYMRGDVIDIRFVAGEPDEVLAERAIGVFLEPASGEGGGVP